MKRPSKLASILTGAVAVAALAGASAFAEDRPANETGRERTRIERNRDASASSDRSRVERRSSASNDERRSQQQPQSYDRRSESRDTRNYDRRNDNRDSRNRDGSYDRRDASSSGRYDNRNNNRYDNNRNDSRYDNRNHNGYDNRNRSYGRYDNRGSYNRYDRSRPQYYRGRVSRYERYGSGFRVWIVGAPFPFFIPEVRFRAFPFRIGVDIRLGGYYNPGGYYDYYDVGPIGAYSSGELRGVVESVDYRRGTFVIHDDISGDFVTAVMRSRDRLMDDLRPGDYVELSGAWTRGVFEAYRVAGIDTGAYRR
ncbi:MAG TPA: hypothetical protein VJ276_06615 [Thermoanaerobaculia bacterium]|nr:hypothetical protein [Thermoanaerobaculia bacterium]